MIIFVSIFFSKHKTAYELRISSWSSDVCSSDLVSGTVAGVDVAGDDGAPLGVNLLADAVRRRRADPWRGWNWAFAAIAVIAIAMAMWQLLSNRRAAADALAEQANARAREAREVAVDKRRLVDLVEGMAYLQHARAVRPTTVEVLDALGRLLPDST